MSDILIDEFNKLDTILCRIDKYIVNDNFIIPVNDMITLVRDYNEQVGKIINIHDKELKIHIDAVEYWKTKAKK